MVQAMHPFQVADVDFQILLRCIEGFMAQQLSDVGDINFPLKQMRSNAVSKTVNGYVFLNHRSPPDRFHDKLVDGFPVERIAVLGKEQESGIRLLAPQKELSSRLKIVS